MNLEATEMLSIDQRSIAKLLKLLKNGSNVRCQMNKIMDNISWKLGNEPNMVLCGKISKVDVVAESILGMDLVNIPFAYYIVEIVDDSIYTTPYNAENIDNISSSGTESTTSKSQFVGACICSEDDFTSIKINCYTFIDWLNGQDLFTSKFMKKITIVNALDSIVHIRVNV